MVYNYQVLVDTREQTPWKFFNSRVATLSTGDYSIDGYEHLVSIERKTLSDFAKSVMQDRFYRELERLEKFKYPYLLLDFNEDHLLRYPHSCDLPNFVKRKIRINGKFLFKKLKQIEENYKINIVFCNCQGAAVAEEIFKQVIENEQKEVQSRAAA